MTGSSPEKADVRWARKLLAVLEQSSARPLAQRQLMHKLNVPPDERPAVRRTIREMVDRGTLVRMRGGKLAAALKAGTLTGVLHRHPDGYGFITPERGGEDLFVPPGKIGNHLNGDRVVLRVVRDRPGRGEAEIVRSLEPRRRALLGVYVERHGEGRVRPLEAAMSQAIEIPMAQRRGARPLDVVRMELVTDQSAPPEGKILEVLGNLDDPGTDVEVLAHKYGLELEFERRASEAADALPDRIDRREARQRSRFEDPPPVTIDGETAKDFDDAISVEELPRGRFRLFVHIADVAHFVPPDSVLDLEARHRGTSVYFPHRVLPMFPEKLSNDLCSLRPGVDRLVQSVILEIEADGTVSRSSFADGVIRSAARLTYRQVARVLAGEERVRGVHAKLLPMLHAAGRLRVVLERRRRARGSVDFDLPEPQILLDVEGVMTGITIEPRNEAHRLIEEFMLAANEAVASQLERSGVPCMYRVHDAPDPLKLDALEEFTRSFGINPPSRSGKLRPQHLRQLLEPFEDRPEYTLVSQVALRSMKRALYSTENTGHFGLAAPTYCHFTSPIRRYPDLVVHRLLRISRCSTSGEPPDWFEGLTGVAESSSERERNAEAAERELLVWKKLAFIENRVGDCFEGIITGVTNFGLFVQLTENLVEGLVRVEELGEERFEFEETRMQLKGRRSGDSYRLGDRLKVIVVRVDRVLRRVDFALAPQSGKATRSGPGRGGVSARGVRRPAQQGARRARGARARSASAAKNPRRRGG